MPETVEEYKVAFTASTSLENFNALVHLLLKSTLNDTECAELLSYAEKSLPKNEYLKAEVKSVIEENNEYKQYSFLINV